MTAANSSAIQGNWRSRPRPCAGSRDNLGSCAASGSSARPSGAPPRHHLGFRCPAEMRVRADLTPSAASPGKSALCSRTGCRACGGRPGGRSQLIHADRAKAALQEKAGRCGDDDLPRPANAGPKGGPFQTSFFRASIKIPLALISAFDYTAPCNATQGSVNPGCLQRRTLS